MMQLYYTVTDTIGQTIHRIDTLRQTIVLAPLTPRHELAYRTDAMLGRLHALAQFLDVPVTKLRTGKLAGGGNHATAEELMLLRLRDTIHFLHFAWLGNANPLTARTAEELVTKTLGGVRMQMVKDISHAMLKTAKYLESGNDHPVIQAAVAFAQDQALSLAPIVTIPLSLTCSYRYLYKFGFDIRGLVTFESSLWEDRQIYEETLDQARSTGNLTHWNQLFAQAILHNLTATWEKIRIARHDVSLPATTWHLNDRQRAILSLLEDPQASVNNRNVQKTFRISQITASRDLAHLTNLGLLSPHGKGRSIYYTRI